MTTDLESPRAEVKADITALPFEADAFDLILCSHVLEHVPDDDAAMRELARVLAPGGLAVIQSPVNYDEPETFEDPSMGPEDRLRYFSQVDHVRVYGCDLDQRLERAGFEVVVSEYAKRFSADDARRFGLVPSADPLRNDLYLCSLPA